MYFEGIGEVTLLSKTTIQDERGKDNGGVLSIRECKDRVGMRGEKLGIVKARERLDLIIRDEVGITYGQMMCEARGAYRREIRDLVGMSLVECLEFGEWMMRNRMRLRRKYPSAVVRTKRTREDEDLHDASERIERRNKRFELR